MSVQRRKNIINAAGGILGAVGGGLLGNPMLGYKIGSGLTAAATSGMQDSPERKDYFVHSDPNPNAYYSTAHNARPLMKTEYVMPEQTRGDNALSLLSAFGGAGAAYGMEGIMKKFAPIAMDAVPAAKTGTFIPPNAPSHEQGGVKLVNKNDGQVMAEAEGNEYVIPGQSVDQIINSDNYAEIGRKFINEVGRLREKGMNEFTAETGLKLDSLFTPNPYASFNRHQTGVPFAGQHQGGSYNAFDMISPILPGLNQQNTPQEASIIPEANQVTTPPTQNFDYYDDAAMDDAFGRLLGRSQPFGSGLVGSQTPTSRGNPTQKATDPLSTAFDKAIGAQERAYKQGNLLRWGQGLINARGLMEPMRPSRPLTMPGFDRIEFADDSAARINQAERELGIGLEASSQMTSPERIAMTTGLLGNYGQQMAQISEAKTGLMNRQAEINAQISAQEKQAQLAVDAQNREMRVAEAATKHARDQVGLAGISDAITKNIKERGAKDTNVAELSVLQSILSGMSSDKQAEFLTRMAPLLRASGINFNPSV